ncbi:MAG: hypothetical protein U9P42_10760 [Candidatus Fermentibacteria bacterium]|nr:hypothetical protein [Candidatus Fermentibacteria bacterium]
MTNLKIRKSLGFDNRVKYSSFRAVTLVVIICLLSVLPASAQENYHSIEFFGTLQSYMFNEHYDFTPGFGAETQIRFWPKTNLGLAIAGGMSFFTIDQLIATTGDPVKKEVAKEGTLLFFPIGGSILFSQNSNLNAEFILEAGVRYVFVNSNLEKVTTTTDSGSVTINKIKYDIGNGIIGLVSVSVVTELSQELNLSFGLGYQFDITKGGEVTLDIPREHELSSFLIRAGLITDF